jgi:hypothetical protein
MTEPMTEAMIEEAAGGIAMPVAGGTAIPELSGGTGMGSPVGTGRGAIGAFVGRGPGTGTLAGSGGTETGLEGSGRKGAGLAEARSADENRLMMMETCIVSFFAVS